jgi:hypothetical protein
MHPSKQSMGGSQWESFSSVIGWRLSTNGLLKWWASFHKAKKRSIA